MINQSVEDVNCIKYIVMVNEMLFLFNIFPRQIGSTDGRRIVSDVREFLDVVNRYNGKKRLFVSVYNYTSPEHYDDIVLDKIFFDFDDEETMMDDVINLHKYCMKHNYKHIMFFSGKGFHFYILTKNGEKLFSPKECLYNAHLFFIKKLNINVDEKIIGDIARMATIPNTFNLKRKRFCIPISEEDLEKGYDYIREKAKSQNFKYIIYGKRLFDISKFDVENKNNNFFIPGISSKSNFSNSILAKNMPEIDDSVVDCVPPCIKNLLLAGKEGKHIGWKERGYIICYFRDYEGLLLNEMVALLKKFLNARDFRHSVIEEKQPQYLYRDFVRDRVIFPSCEKLKEEGVCKINNFCGFSFMHKKYLRRKKYIIYK